MEQCSICGATCKGMRGLHIHQRGRGAACGQAMLEIENGGMLPVCTCGTPVPPDVYEQHLIAFGCKRRSSPQKACTPANSSKRAHVRRAEDTGSASHSGSDDNHDGGMHDADGGYDFDCADGTSPFGSLRHRNAGDSSAASYRSHLKPRQQQQSSATDSDGAASDVSSECSIEENLNVYRCGVTAQRRLNPLHVLRTFTDALDQYGDELLSAEPPEEWQQQWHQQQVQHTQPASLRELHDADDSGSDQEAYMHDSDERADEAHMHDSDESEVAAARAAWTQRQVLGVVLDHGVSEKGITRLLSVLRDVQFTPAALPLTGAALKQNVERLLADDAAKAAAVQAGHDDSTSSRAPQLTEHSVSLERILMNDMGIVGPIKFWLQDPRDALQLLLGACQSTHVARGYTELRDASGAR